MGDADDTPPADYPLYGVAGTWVRWLEFVEGESGRPTWTVWLGHGARHEPARVVVGSAPRARFDARHAGIPPGPSAHVAFSAGLHLTGYTLPHAEVPRPEGLVRAITDETYRQASGCQAWPEVGWTVDGVEVAAHVWRFAGFWAAFTTQLPESYVMAIGTGTDPERLRFERVRDGQPYGFDLHAPLPYGARRGERLPVARPDAHRFHPDQLALLEPS